MSRLFTICTRCGSSRRPEDRFCPSCGASQTGAGRNAGPDEGWSAPVDDGDDLLARLQEVTVGAFEVRGLLGRGGMAAVYLAHDLSLNRRVALKVMLPELRTHGDMAERFLREARTAARLDHPNVVPVFSATRAKELSFFVMKFVDGYSLDDILRHAGALPIQVVQYVIARVAEALQYAHDEGVIHRDVKPGNVLVDQRGSVALTDFGIAKAVESTQMTHTGTGMGTPLYMSPEQCRGQHVGAASDQYSLGIAAYHLLAGVPPFTGPVFEVQLGHTSAAPRPLAQARPDCPPGLAAAVSRMIEKDPAQRWPSLADAIPALTEGMSLDERGLRRQLVGLFPPVRTAAQRLPATPASPIPSSSRGREAPTVSSGVLTIALPRSELEVGERMRVEVALHGIDGRTVVPQQVSWGTTEPGVATVDDVGVVCGLAPGEVSVLAISSGEVARLPLQVVPARPASVSLAPDRVDLQVGAVAQVAATVADARGAALPDAPVTWRAEREAVASIDGQGRVAALAPGSTVIIAVCGAASASAPVRVSAVAVAAVAIAGPRAIDLEEGEARQLAAELRDARGVVLADRRIDWSVENGSVASVSPDGLLHGRNAGETRITAACEGRDATVTVRVRETPATALVIEGAPPALAVGRKARLRVRVEDSRGRVLHGRRVAWRSSDADLAVVSDDGVVRGRSVGRVRIEAVCETVSAAVDLDLSPAKPLPVGTLVAAGGFVAVAAAIAAIVLSGPRVQSVARPAADTSPPRVEARTAEGTAAAATATQPPAGVSLGSETVTPGAPPRAATAAASAGADSGTIVLWNALPSGSTLLVDGRPVRITADRTVRVPAGRRVVVLRGADGRRSTPAPVVVAAGGVVRWGGSLDVTGGASASEDSRREPVTAPSTTPAGGAGATEAERAASAPPAAGAPSVPGAFTEAAEQEVRRFARALESGDMASMRQIHPRMSAAEESTWRQLLEGAGGRVKTLVVFGARDPDTRTITFLLRVSNAATARPILSQKLRATFLPSMGAWRLIRLDTE